MESLFNYFVAVVDPLTVFIGKERSDERNRFKSRNVNPVLESETKDKTNR